MNKKIVISADCVCDLPERLIKKYSVHIVPFYVSIRDAIFQDYTEADLSSIREYLEKDEVIVASIPASVEEYREHFLKLTENGTKRLLHISVSSNLSKGYNNAVKAAEEIDGVYVINSEFVSHGMGLFVLAAADLARSNATIEIILRELEIVKNRISCSFVFKDTHYVANNNRFSAMLSNLMNFFKIKPILRLKRNELKVTKICFGSKMSYVKKYVKKMLRKSKNISDDILFIAIDDSSEELKKLVYDEVTRKINWKRIYFQDVSATTYCNLGPGSIGIMFYTKK